MNTVEQSVADVLKDNVESLALLDLTPTTYLISSGYVDSFEIVDCIFALEKAFDITIPFDDLELEDFDTVQSVASIVTRIQETAVS
jgi:acyl carrier protein